MTLVVESDESQYKHISGKTFLFQHSTPVLLVLEHCSFIDFIKRPDEHRLTSMHVRRSFSEMFL